MMLFVAVGHHSLVTPIDWKHDDVLVMLVWFEWSPLAGDTY